MTKIYVASPYTALLKKSGTNEVFKVAKNAVALTKKYLDENAASYNESNYIFNSPVISHMFTNAKVPYVEIFEVTRDLLYGAQAISFFSDDEHRVDFIESSGCFHEYAIAIHSNIPVIGDDEIIQAYKEKYSELEKILKEKEYMYSVSHFLDDKKVFGIKI